MGREVDHEAEEREELSLSDAAEHLLEECRMVLPGIQALFGFQLVAVFSNGFDQLDGSERRLHLLAIALTAVAVAIIMTPAAYHRQRHPLQVSRTFLVVSTRLLLLSMPPLALAICLDFYLIASIIVGGSLAPVLATALVAVFIVLWLVLPRARSLERLLAGIK
jgi:hypothetical protein